MASWNRRVFRVRSIDIDNEVNAGESEARGLMGGDLGDQSVGVGVTKGE